MHEQVRPGDLITADLMNRLLSDIEALEGRVTALEATVPGDLTVSITGVSGTQRVGEELTVSGQNFEVPTLFNGVTIGGVLVQSFNAGSDASTLRFNIPVTITGIPRTVPIIVTNRYGTAVWPDLLVLPASQPTPQGQLVITAQPGPGGTVNVGDTVTFVFELDSQTNIAEIYQLQAVFTSAVGTSDTAWLANSSVVDASSGTGAGAPVISSITIDSQTPALVGIRVTVPAGATSVNLALRASSVNNPTEPQMNLTSSPTVITIGEVVEEPDPRIAFSNRLVVGAGRAFSDPLAGDGVESPFGGGATQIRVTAEFEVAGTYAYSSQFIPATPGVWNRTTLTPDAPTVEVASGEQFIVVGIAMLLASDPGDNSDDALLEIRVARTDSDDTGAFESWTLIPIRGF